MAVVSRTAHEMPKGRFEARSGAACGAIPTAFSDAWVTSSSDK